MLRCINNGQMKDSRKSESASEEDGLDGRGGKESFSFGLGSLDQSSTVSARRDGRRSSTVADGGTAVSGDRGGG